MTGLSQLIDETHRRSLWRALGICCAMTVIAGAAFPGPGSGQVAPRTREWMYEQYRRLPEYIRGGAIEPRWVDEGSRFWFTEESSRGTMLKVVDPPTGSVRELFSLEWLRSELGRALGERIPDGAISFSGLEFDTREEGVVELTVEDRRIEVDARSGLVRRVRDAPRTRLTPTLAESASPDGAWAARISANNVWLRSLSDGREVRLTTDGTEDQPWGGPYRPRLLWSPDGARLAVLRQDQRPVPTIPVVTYLSDRPSVRQVRSWEAAGPFESLDLFVFNVETQTRTRIEANSEGTAWRHWYLLGWSPDGTEVLFATVTSDWQRLRVAAADHERGTVRTLFEETRETFFHIQPYRTPSVAFLPNGEGFVWKSDRDGWHHLYVHDLEGKVVRRLTEGRFEVVDILSIDGERGLIYFTAHLDADHPYDTHIASVSLNGGEVRQLTEGRGVHSASFSPTMEFFVDQYQGVDLLPVAELRSVQGELVMSLSAAEIDAPRGFVWVEPEEFVVKAADGETDLHGVLYKPYDFDEDALYPVVEIMVGRPTVAVNELLRSHILGQEALAQLGFIVVALDARGTPERGHGFHAAVYGQMGRLEIPDHVAALDQLFADRPYMDRTRVGVVGSSYGGYYTIRAILQAPELYKVAVADAPYDPRGDAVIPYMGLPQTNPGGYASASNIRLADQLQGRLLIQHGTADEGAYFHWTMQLVEAFVDAGKPIDVLALPDQGHVLVGSSVAYADEARIRYLLKHLQASGSGRRP